MLQPIDILPPLVFGELPQQLVLFHQYPLYRLLVEVPVDLAFEHMSTHLFGVVLDGLVDLLYLLAEVEVGVLGLFVGLLVDALG